jgi:hypothetical protein
MIHSITSPARASTARICIVHVSFDQRAPPCFRRSLHVRSHRSGAGRKSLLFPAEIPQPLKVIEARSLAVEQHRRNALDLQSLAGTLAGLLWLIEVTRSRLARGRNSEVRLHSDKGGDIQ